MKENIADIPNTVEGYEPSLFMKNGHINTIYTSLLRKPSHPGYERVRIGTADDDFLDVDWIKSGNKNLVVLCHGLEGNSGSQYMKGMSSHLSNLGFDIVAMNYRSCSGELNHQLTMYHSGATGDLEEVLKVVHKGYEKIFLAGFSLGANLILKYLGEKGSNLDYPIEAAASISVPADLKSSSHKIGAGFNRVYEIHFLISLQRRMRAKTRQFPELATLAKKKKIRTLCDFDDVYTGPIHGFRDGNDYYEKCSSRNFIPEIKVPALIINALDDPFLTEACFPYKQVNENPFVEMLTPTFGGHVGFYKGRGQNCYQENVVGKYFLEGTI
ncbi:MAG: alpha/beta fold hydrolase [Saprospiraceae bacterium]|nr:alpha/beta fold hydrolase [Saprospiraceae bacterium]